MTNPPSAPAFFAPGKGKNQRLFMVSHSPFSGMNNLDTSSSAALSVEPKR
jgi:hypothetical protein|tara:strand:- start:458 stop:607 length:150 start_codon:yes stop_codon:yes gene_type:complete